MEMGNDNVQKLAMMLVTMTALEMGMPPCLSSSFLEKSKNSIYR
jgi:hypothetical protein